MNTNDFISLLQTNCAILLPVSSARTLELTQNNLQNMRIAMIPMDLLEIYKNVAGGIILGDANIFGPDKYDRVPADYELPDMVSVNRELSGNKSLSGKTIFGRNQMFWFAFDAFGRFYMLDVLTMRPLRDYGTDAVRAITDCLMFGKI